MLHKNTAALLHHMMLKRHKQLLESAVRHASGHEDEDVRMSETRIYVGLNDSETRQQKYETEQYLEVLKNVCKKHHAAFSVDVEQGGYYHEDGEYTEENSFVLELIDTDKKTVKSIAKDLCTIFHQESVLITESDVKGYYVAGADSEGENEQ